MTIFTSDKFLVLVLLSLLLVVTVVVAQKDSNDICKEKDKPGFKLNLTGAMIFSDHIWMMDNKLQVYEVPKFKYDGSYGQMIINIKGVPIEQYWNPFKSNKGWDCVKKHYMSIYHLINNHTGDVLINFFIHGFCKFDNGTEYSLCYNLETQKFCPLPTLSIPKKIQFFVDTGLKIYHIGLFEDKEGNTTKLFPVISVWKFEYEPDNKTISEGEHTDDFMMYYLVEHNNRSNRYVSAYFASDFAHKIDSPPAGYDRENITDWNLSKDYIPVGYLYNGSFYLYALDKLIIFEDKMPSFDQLIDISESKLLFRSKVTVIPLSEYFRCDSNNDPNVTYPKGNTTVNSTSPLTLDSLIIIAVLLLLLILIAAILTYCLSNKQKSEKQSKAKDSKEKKLSRKPENPSMASLSVASSKVSTVKGGGGGGSTMAATSRQSSIAGGGKSKAASSTSAAAVSSSKMMPPQSKIYKKNK